MVSESTAHWWKPLHLQYYKLGAEGDIPGKNDKWSTVINNPLSHTPKHTYMHTPTHTPNRPRCVNPFISPAAGLIKQADMNAKLRCPAHENER